MIDFILKKLTIEGFRSFQAEQSFVLDRKPGLYFIGGINKEKPKLGSNAVGKSTIWDAITWCFYGKTIEGLRGHVIKNTKSKVTSVNVELLRDGIFYKITRTHAPNSLIISPPLAEAGKDAETISQADLNQFIGLDYEKFLYALIVGQFNAAFLELDPMVKLNIFSSIMDLSLWEKCAKAASTFSANSITNKNLLETKLEGIQSRLEALKAERSRQKASYEAFQQGRDEQISELERKADKTLTKALAMEKEMDYQELVIKELRNKETSYYTNHKHMDSLVHLSKESEVELKQQIDLLIQERNNYQTNFNKWKNLTASCPYCTQDVDASVVSLHKKEHTLQILAATKQIKELESKREEAANEILSFERDAKIVKKDLESITFRIQEESKKITVLDSDRKQLVQVINQYKSSAQELRHGINPFQELTRATEQGIVNTEAELKEIQSQIDVISKEYTGMNFWVRGFKELRLWIMTDALMALAIETNNAVAQLGLPDWRLKFQMERETSTGDISKGFHAMIHSPEFDDEDYIPFKAYSGGERQRLKLGGAIGFGSLIKDYKGVSFNISVWDEPTSFLSTEGIDDLIQCLYEDAIFNNKVIYIVDQRHLENALFESVITVEMLKTGSNIVE